jgi:hypothetical protein
LSLLIAIGNSAGSNCGAGLFALEKAHEAQKFEKFPVIFPVSSELDFGDWFRLAASATTQFCRTGYFPVGLK